jgi:hypothetical protein
MRSRKRTRKKRRRIRGTKGRRSNRMIKRRGGGEDCVHYQHGRLLIMKWALLLCHRISSSLFKYS